MTDQQNTRITPPVELLQVAPNSSWLFEQLAQFANPQGQVSMDEAQVAELNGLIQARTPGSDARRELRMLHAMGASERPEIQGQTINVRLIGNLQTGAPVEEATAAVIVHEFA